MRIVRFLVIFIAIFSFQAVLADNTKVGTSKPCGMIAKACSKAGFTNNKKFWFDCMKPVMMGKTVAGVKVDDATVRSCRADKIKELQNEVTELQGVSAGK